MFRTVTLTGLLLAVCAVLSGCKRSTEQLAENTRTYAVKGVVVAVDGGSGEVTLQHEAIPGLMPAMTMPYKLVFGNVVSELHQGDRIRARLLVDKTPDGELHNARLDELAVLAQARPDYRPQSNYHVPAAGDAVPDFRFTNQDGKPLRLQSLRGKVVLITFVYTRCPLGDFCPKMSRNLAAIDAALHRSQTLYSRTRLLSLSFDPEFDTPAVLRAYGAAYTGGAGFSHWQFAAPAAANLPAMERYFNVGVTGSGASLTHSLSTVLIGPDGKIAAWYPGNEWSPDAVAETMKRLTLATFAPGGSQQERAGGKAQPALKEETHG